MPIKIPNDLPASKILKEENIFVMDENRALAQQIRPLQLLILNIMPTKIVTETQLLRMLSNTPLQIEAKFCLECGQKQDLSCPQCQQKVELGMKFCSNCGQNLQGG